MTISQIVNRTSALLFYINSRPHSVCVYVFSCLDKFDKFSRDILRRASQPVVIPETGSVYDYGIDCKAGQFVKWTEKTTEKGRSAPSSYVVTPEVRSAEDDVHLGVIQVLRYTFFWKYYPSYYVT